MKKTLLILILAAMTVSPGYAESSRADEARLYLTQCSLKNLGTALSMWYEDNNQTFPNSLDELVPNYLRAIPQGPLGSSSDWKYTPATDRKSFQMALALPGQKLAPSATTLGAPSFRYGSDLQPGTVTKPKSLNYAITLPEQAAPDWTQDGAYFTRTDQRAHMSFRLAGPFAENQDGHQWVKQASYAWENSYRVQVESSVEFADRELTGLEMIGVDGSYKFHKLFLTDGELGWVFSLSVQEGADYQAQLSNFKKMIARRSRS